MIYLVTNAPMLIKSGNYEIISIEKSLELLEPLKIVGTDTETEGFDVHTKKLLSLQLGCFEYQIVIDCLTVDVKLYKNYLESDRTFLFWNAKFDLKFLYHHGIMVKNVWDGFLAEKLLWLGYPPGMHEMSLKAAGLYYVNIELDKSIRGQIITKGLVDDVIEYAALDVKYLESIREKQILKLQEKELVKALKVENEFVKCLAYIEYCGVKLSTEKWKAKLDSDVNLYEEKLQQLNAWVVDNQYRLKGKYCRVDIQGDLFSGFDTSPKCCINWTSPKQVIPLFEELDLDLLTEDRVTKKPKKSTDIKVIEPQAGKSELIPLFVEFKKAAILVNTFGEKFLDLINPVTRRIHPNFWQLGADTGRLSSSEPNAQNLPRDPITRACFIAEPGNKWISADYQGQETALMASIANDKAMLEELEHGSGDLHSLAAKAIFTEEIPRDLPVIEVKNKFKHLRQEAKGYEFCFNYGGQASTLVRNYGIDENKAEEIYRNYMEGFSGLRDYQKWARKQVRQDGFILLSPITGHKAFIYDFEELKRLQKRQAQPGFWEYYREMKHSAPNCDTVQDVRRLAKRWADSEKQSINYRIQGAGALTFKYASIFLFRYIIENNLFGVVKYTLPCHDEINLECPEEIAEEIAKVLVDCMERGAKPFCTRIKLGADVTIGDYWIH